MIKRVIKRFLPRRIWGGIWGTFRTCRILSVGFGQYRTMKLWDCVDSNDDPIPWYSYPAIEYILQLDFSDKSIFEYGSGNSTRFSAGAAKHLVSIEDNQDWYDTVKGEVPTTVEYHLLEDKKEYIESIRGFPNGFDVIVIDGSHRYDCATEAIHKLRDDGFIILDNSDWMEKTSRLLRESI